MKISFDREEYLSIASIFESGKLDDVTNELSEFNDDPEDMAYELAYTRYALAKCEARHNAIVEAVAWERECEAVRNQLRPFRNWPELAESVDSYQAARAEVDRLIAESEGEG